MSGQPSTNPFDRVPEVYTRARPEYPPALWDVLDTMLPQRGRALRAVEVGPGTG